MKLTKDQKIGIALVVTALLGISIYFILGKKAFLGSSIATGSESGADFNKRNGLVPPTNTTTGIGRDPNDAVVVLPVSKPLTTTDEPTDLNSALAVYSSPNATKNQFLAAQNIVSSNGIRMPMYGN